MCSVSGSGYLPWQRSTPRREPGGPAPPAGRIDLPDFYISSDITTRALSQALAIALPVKSPTAAVCAAQEIVTFGTVCNATLGTIVLDFLANPVGDETQQHILYQYTTVL